MKKQELKQKIEEFLESGEDFKNEALENLNLSVRTYNCMKRKGINFLEDVNGMNLKDLLKIRNLGNQRLDEFLEAAKRFGYLVENDKLTRIFDLEENQINYNEEQILIENMDLPDKIKRKLSSFGFLYLSDIVYNLHLKCSWVQCNKVFIEELKKGMLKYGYTVNETGFFRKSEQKDENLNILFEQFKNEGIQILNLINKCYFKKDSRSMSKINKAFETYLNFLVEEKFKANEDLDQIENEIDQMRENYKIFVDNQRQLMKKDNQRDSFVARMTAKNSEIRRYHHGTNNNHEIKHSHNLFFNSEREL